MLCHWIFNTLSKLHTEPTCQHKEERTHTIKPAHDSARFLTHWCVTSQNGSLFRPLWDWERRGGVHLKLSHSRQCLVSLWVISVTSARRPTCRMTDNCDWERIWVKLLSHPTHAISQRRQAGNAPAHMSHMWSPGPRSLTLAHSGQNIDFLSSCHPKLRYTNIYL